MEYCKCSKISNNFSFCSQIKGLLRAGIHKILIIEYQTGKTLIRLLPGKQSDLGLHCLFRHFKQTTSVQNFRFL